MGPQIFADLVDEANKIVPSLIKGMALGRREGPNHLNAIHRKDLRI